MKTTKYSPIELMACVASRQLEDGRTVAVGTGLPLIAATLAQKTHAPNLMMFFESGSLAPIIPTLPMSVGDSRVMHKALAVGNLAGVMEAAQVGVIDYAFLGGAQIDKYGNLNATMIGTDYSRPKVRLPGSGGANDLGSNCWRTLIISTHEKRRFVEKIDFITTPGYLDGPGARERAGLSKGTGPYRVITDIALLDFDEKTKLMRLISTHPGVTVEDVITNTGFKLIIPDTIGVTAEPTDEELRLLREEIDPAGYIIGRRSQK